MSSINPECNKLKKEYDECFNSWYVDSFLKGKKSNKCDALFKEYRACIMKTLKEKKIDNLIDESIKNSTVNKKK
ncbi:hypothetical protein PIROE2DRAFT_48506 [Piromyces sp. E2]|nr:hypothetical protein PIROE2DRAFT_48506 [Piromyces sp. E2]|eukprot:OUM57697.1 hypothetical protein PIROE2DRAFT_48506 [Piromyces sp. E2]